MNELLYGEEVFQLIGFCMQIHRELGRATTKSSTKTPLPLHLVALEFHSRASRVMKSTTRESSCRILITPTSFEAKAVEKLTDSHINKF